MIQQEISEKSQDVAKLENNLKILLLPRDPRDEKTAGNSVKLTNCQWGGAADANGVAELVILTRANA